MTAKENLHIEVEQTEQGRRVLIEFIHPEPEWEIVADDEE